MSLYLTSRYDSLHAASERRPALAQCGKPLAGAVAVSGAQVLVFFGDARCLQCFPAQARLTLNAVRRAA